VGRKGGRRSLKRKPAPQFWPIHRKEAIWVVKPSPGPHPISCCLPLTLVLRDILGIAKTRKEVKTIISEEKVIVDGKVLREELFPTGLMDVISISDAGKTYRVLPSEKGLILHPVEKDEAGFKLCRIEDKSTVRGGHVQLNLHDGRNVLIKVKDPQKPEEDLYQTLDTVKISLPEQEVAGHIKLAEGASALIVGGKNTGRHGKIVAMEKREGQKRRNSLVTIEDERGNRFQTTIDYVFAVGETKPQISLPEVETS